MMAALFRYWDRCRSTQLKDALSFPPTNHFQKGGSLESSTLSQRVSHVSISAYSSKHFGKFFSEKRSLTAGSFRLACATNSLEGWKYASSFQCTAIWASLGSATRVAGLASAMLTLPSNRKTE